MTRIDRDELLIQLRDILRSEIPAARHAGITLESYDGSTLALGAPLALNVNQMRTAFAGSLNSAATLAGWSLVWLMAMEDQQPPSDIVLQDCSVQYLRPVTRDFTARTRRPDPDRVGDFLDALRRRGRGRIEISAEIQELDLSAMIFTGRFVAQHR
ncbi:MAG: YiiD C-terminal domain-containing protein [Gemmatimonadota bacterium]